jgi:5-methyltetrahydrofolate--homocysteine methyltransferase
MTNNTLVVADVNPIPAGLANAGVESAAPSDYHSPADMSDDTPEARCRQIAGSIVDLMPRRTELLTRAALDAGLEPRAILLDGLAAGMKRVGELFARKEFFVPEVLSASRAMDAGFAVLRPKLDAGGARGLGRIVLGVIEGDIHDIGKNIVKVLLEAEGFEVIDLGRDVSVAEFVRAVREQKPDALGMSALMTTTMPGMALVIQELTHAGLRDGVKVLVGGAPLSADYARSIGADGYAPDAAAAVNLMRGLVPRD